MPEINKALYQEVILEHNKNPRHFGEIDPYTDLQVGNNALCGDKLALYANLVDDKIANIGFVGEGCAIFKSSCSMMTDAVIGKTKAEATEIITNFQNMIMDSAPMTSELENKLGKLSLFMGVKQYPARVKCALLGYRTLQSILDGKSGETISTEETN